MYKMAVIGDSTSILGFKPIGVTAYSLDNPGDIIDLWPEIIEKEYVIIFMTEPVFEAAKPLIRSIEDQPVPAVLAIPSTAGSTGIARQYMEDLIERAIGTKEIAGQHG